MKYVIDPYLFSFDENMTSEEVNRYMGQFVELEKWWKVHKEDIYVLKDTDSLLWEEGFYPLEGKLKPLLEKYEEEIDYRDVSRTMTHYFQQTQCIESVCDEKLIGLSSCKWNKESEARLENRPEVFQDSMKCILWHILRINLVMDKMEPEEYVVFARNIDALMKATCKYEHLSDDQNKCQLIEEEKEMGINCHSSVSAFQHHEKTPFLVFKYQQSKDDLYLGVRCKVMQDGKMEALDKVDECFVISLQDSFYKDFCDNGYSGKPSDIRSALDSMSKAVRGIRHGNEHNMRTGKGGNDPYLFHGEYAAMRKNVTTSIKLHFWKKPPHYIFAKIGEHDFFTVPWEEKRSVR